METETEPQPVTPAVAGWWRSDRFDAWCDECQAETEPDSTTDTRWCGVCGTRRA